MNGRESQRSTKMTLTTAIELDNKRRLISERYFFHNIILRQMDNGDGRHKLFLLINQYDGGRDSFTRFSVT